MDRGTIELVCIAVIAGAVLVQTIILIAFVIGVGKAAKSIKQEIDDLQSTVMPVARNTGQFLARLGPKVESTVTKVESTVADVSELARRARTQATEVQNAVDQVVQTVKDQSLRIDEMVSRQTTRVDEMVSTTLDTVDKAAAVATKAVKMPFRQVYGVLAGIKAAVETLGLTRGSNGRPPAGPDKDLFV